MSDEAVSTALFRFQPGPVAPQTPENIESYETSFGDIKSFELEVNKELKKRKVPRKGIKVVSQIRTTGREMAYLLTFDENNHELRKLLMGDKDSPMPGKTLEGWGYFQQDDEIQGEAFFVHSGFKCAVSIESPAGGEGEDFDEVQLRVEVFLSSPGKWSDKEPESGSGEGGGEGSGGQG